MKPEKQAAIEKKINSLLYVFNDKIICQCKSTEEATFAVCRLNLYLTDMLMKVMQANLPAQEAKAALKVALDSALFDHGMSVMIHEFQQQ